MQSPLPRLRPMGVGDLLDAMFALHRLNFGLFAGIVAVLVVPETLLKMLIAAHTPTTVSVTQSNGTTTVDSSALTQSIWLDGLSLLVTFVFLELITAALARAISERYLGRQISVAEAYGGIGWGLFIRLVLAVILWGFIVGFASLLFFIPGIYMFVRLYFVSQVIVLERTGVWDSLSRSWNLTRGSFWRVFGILLLVFIMVQILTGLLTGGFIALVALGAVHGTAASVWSQVVSGVVGIFVRPIQLGVAVLLYYDLRIRKEGFDLELMARSLESRQPV